jgi:hypothetical protein
LPKLLSTFQESTPSHSPVSSPSPHLIKWHSQAVWTTSKRAMYVLVFLLVRICRLIDEGLSGSCWRRCDGGGGAQSPPPPLPGAHRQASPSSLIHRTSDGDPSSRHIEQYGQVNARSRSHQPLRPGYWDSLDRFQSVALDSACHPAASQSKIRDTVQSSRRVCRWQSSPTVLRRSFATPSADPSPKRHRSLGNACMYRHCRGTWNALHANTHVW